MEQRMIDLQKLIEDIDKFCHDNKIDLIIIAQARDENFTIKLMSKGSKRILNIVGEVLETLKSR